MSNSKRVRDFCFTLNNYTENEILDLHNIGFTGGETGNVVYLVIGKEQGANLTKHLQGFVSWKNGKTFKRTKDLLGERVHLEERRGTPFQAMVYCKKDGCWEQWGTEPKQKTKSQKELQREVWNSIIEKAKLGEFDEIPASYTIRYYNSLKRIHKDYMSRPDDLTERCNYWYWGKPGTGKSRKARSEFGSEYYLKNCNKWWDGYRGEDTVIIDELELDHKFMGHFLKIWADWYAFTAEVKGTSCFLRPMRIIVTSNYSPDEIWMGDSMLVAAIRERFNVVEFFNI